MVSNYLDIEPEALIQRLKDMATRYGDDPEYKKLRAALPEDFPF